MLGSQPTHKSRKVKTHYDIKLPPNIQKAKDHPIEALYNGKLKTTGQTKLGLCPFHDEKTPSFAIYPHTNTWNCFAGCGGGDVINFYMKTHQCSFGSAVSELSK